MAVLTDEVFVTAVRAEVASNPDHRYEIPGGPNSRCLYVYDGKGSCVIGRALIRAGLPVEAVAALDDGVGDAEFTDAPRALPRLGLSERVSDWAGAIQRLQDRGQSDGRALELADRSHG